MALVAGFVGFILLDPPLNVLALVAGGVLEAGEAVLWVRYLKRFRVTLGRSADTLAGARE